MSTKKPPAAAGDDSRKKIGELPQSGWFADQHWAKQLDEDVERFRQKVREHNIPHRKWGTTLLILAEDFYRWAPGSDHAEATPQ